MKKKSLRFGIGVMLVLVLMLTGCSIGKSKDESKNNKTNKVNDNDIVQIEFNSLLTVALTGSGDMYAIGKNTYGWAGNGKLSEVTLLASNVKKFSNDGDFYIDKDDNLYITGLNAIEGGTYDSYEKMRSDIKDVSGGGLGFMAVSNKGELYAYGKKEYSGIGQECKTLTKVEGVTNVSDVFVGLTIVYYVTNNGELYAKERASADGFEKLLDNVDLTDTSSSVVKTKDNKIYTLSYKDGKVIATLNEQANGFISTESIVYYTKDGVILDSNKYIYDSTRLYYPKDVKKMLDIFDLNIDYSENTSGKKYVYINTKGEICLYKVKYKFGDYTTKVDEQKNAFDYSKKNIKKIYEFVSEK